MYIYSRGSRQSTYPCIHRFVCLLASLVGTHGALMDTLLHVAVEVCIPLT